jgi:hypothetical protein
MPASGLCQQAYTTRSFYTASALRRPSPRLVRMSVVVAPGFGTLVADLAKVFPAPVNEHLDIWTVWTPFALSARPIWCLHVFYDMSVQQRAYLPSQMCWSAVPWRLQKR